MSTESSEVKIASPRPNALEVDKINESQYCPVTSTLSNNGQFVPITNHVKQHSSPSNSSPESKLPPRALPNPYCLPALNAHLCRPMSPRRRFARTIDPSEPRLVFLLSGKRKCGKDFVCNKLKSTIDGMGVNAGIVQLASPIKQQYAKDKGLDLQKLMGDGPYKELYRREMVEWSDSLRTKVSI